MNRVAKMLIQNELSSGELLLWAGVPKQGTLFKGSDVFMIPFSLLWGGFAIFWEYSVIQSDAPFFFMLFGIPFVLVGIYIIFGRFYVESKQREKTFYGLTNQRAIIISGLFSKDIKSLSLRTMSDISMSEKKNGFGTIVFGQENQMMSLFMGGGFPGMGGSTVPKFELIENVKNVYNILREQQKS